MDGMQGLMGRLYIATDVVTRFLYLSLLWIGMSLLGIVILGVFPATVALFTVCRKWVMGDTDVGVTRLFWKAYRVDFWRANGLGWILIAAGFVLQADFRFFEHSSGPIKLLVWLLFVVFFFFAILSIYIFPVYVHVQARFFQYFRLAFIIAAVQPFKTIFLLVLLLFVTFYVRGILPILCVGVVGYLVMRVAYSGFAKIEKRTGTTLIAQATAEFEEEK